MPVFELHSLSHDVLPGKHARGAPPLTMRGPAINHIVIIMPRIRLVMFVEHLFNDVGQ